MMNAVEMRWLTELALQRREARKQGKAGVAELARIKTAEDQRQVWLSKGLYQFLDKVQEAAKRGESCYEETMDECPSYIGQSLTKRGFEVELRESDWLRDNLPFTYDHRLTYVLTVRW